MRKNMSKWQFERLMRRYDGEDGGGSATTAADTTTTAETTADTTQTAATETPVTPFKAFTSQADYDREIQQAIKSHEAKLTAKLTPAIKAQLEKEANMTAEQKVQEQLNQLEADKKALAAEKNRIKAESILKDVPEAERAIMLDSIVSDDADETEKRATALAAAIEKATNEKIKVAMKSVTVPNSTSATTAQTQESYGKILGDKLAKSLDESQKAMNAYTIGGRRK